MVQKFKQTRKRLRGVFGHQRDFRERKIQTWMAFCSDETTSRQTDGHEPQENTEDHEKISFVCKDSENKSV